MSRSSVPLVSIAAHARYLSDGKNSGFGKKNDWNRVRYHFFEKFCLLITEKQNRKYRKIKSACALTDSNATLAQFIVRPNYICEIRTGSRIGFLYKISI